MQRYQPFVLIGKLSKTGQHFVAQDNFAKRVEAAAFNCRKIYPMMSPLTICFVQHSISQFLNFFQIDLRLLKPFPKSVNLFQ